mmetsp:Transcript_17836/g.45250  ORF Transcript_17836/g.45250 Transcript_17836/m.45250 type:complete len:213 (-) Transcript_17836:292-930(-)
MGYYGSQRKRREIPGLRWGKKTMAGTVLAGRGHSGRASRLLRRRKPTQSTPQNCNRNRSATIATTEPTATTPAEMASTRGARSSPETASTRGAAAMPAKMEAATTTAAIDDPATAATTAVDVPRRCSSRPRVDNRHALSPIAVGLEATFVFPPNHPRHGHGDAPRNRVYWASRREADETLDGDFRAGRAKLADVAGAYARTKRLLYFRSCSF